MCRCITQVRPGRADKTRSSLGNEITKYYWHILFDLRYSGIWKDLRITSYNVCYTKLLREQGDFVAILGHNGSGKSTMAKHINAILVPTEGTVWIDGYNTMNDEDLLTIRQTAGMVFQNPDNQIIATVVEEDVGFGPENLGIPTKEIWQRVDECLNAVGMQAYRDHSPNKLSGGQKQRIAIAGIMAMQPKCIILDEPTAMLDPSGRKEVLKTIHELNRKQKVTVLLITHYMDEVIEADHVIVMDKGKVVMQGVPKEIFSQVEKLKELRLDVPRITSYNVCYTKLLRALILR